MVDFVHLHVHSDFSILDSSASVKDLADRAEQLGMSHLALTDHGNMFGAMEFLSACEKRKNTVKPIIGCEVYVSPGSRHEKKGSERENRYYHLILLATNREGYFNLVKLCSFAYTEGFYFRPRIDEEILKKFHKGLIALSACASGEIPRLIQTGQTDAAREKALYYRDLFGHDGDGNPNFYLEIQDHGIPAGVLRGGLSQKEIADATAQISGETGIPLVATNDVHYIKQEDYTAHDILLCIGTAQTRTEEKRKKKFYGSEFFLKSGEEMAALFPEYPEAISNTVRIAERCVTDIPKIGLSELTSFLPEIEIPKELTDNSTAYNADDYLRHLTHDGLVRRYAKTKQEGGEAWEKIQRQADYELDTIIEMGFTRYFLIVADFINWAKEQGIPVGPGRGSGAGSIAAYSLRITDIDPLKYDLLFERFLNRDRVSMPDFDIDFANEGRDQVINYVTEKYGRERVGQIITFGTLGAKAVIKDVARSLGISIPESDMISKLIPKDPGISLMKAIEAEPRLRDLRQDARYTELFELAMKLEGLHRHTSIHAAGMVMSNTPLHDFVPLYRDPKTGSIATQYSMGFLESCGLVKMDFLGLKTLDVIKNTVEIIRRKGGEYAGFNIEEAPEDDEATFRMLGEGKSYAVFQFESDGMQDVLKKAKPGSIGDLTALNSLYRPGPMDNIGQFIDSKHGRQAIIYPDPSLEEVLKETYGVIVYQEQVMQVARIIAGFSMGQADILRWAMGKKIREKIDELKEKFIAGAREQGHREEKASEIYELMEPFGGYGFNKSHAAAYSVLAFQTAYLKANFTAEFMAANLTNEINAADKDKLSECIAEARKMGLEIDPPDINKSQKLFTVVDGRIVYGLLGIKGMGDGPSDEIIYSRKNPETGELTAYGDFIDFLNRVDIKTVGKAVMEKLILTGAFDNMDRTRETLLGNLERAIEYAQNIKDDKKFGQASLFGDTGEKEYQDFMFENFPDAGRSERLKSEKELIGFYFSGHPLDEYREIWQKLVKADLGNPESLISVQMTSGNHILVGLVKNLKPHTTSKGSKMAFAVLEDYKGEIELVFFSEAWEKCRDKIIPDKPLILKGKIEYQAAKDKLSFSVDDCINSDEAERLVKEDEAQYQRWDRYRNIWKYASDLNLKFPDLSSPEKIEAGTYTVLGILKSLRTHIDKNNREMAFGLLQDLQGEIELVFFASAWESCKAIAAVDEIIAIKGTIDPAKNKNSKGPQSQKTSLHVSSIVDLNKLLRQAAKRVKIAEDAEETPIEPNVEGAERIAEDAEGISEGSVEKTVSPREIHIRLAKNAADDEAALNSLREILEENPGDCPVYIHTSFFPGSGSETQETVIRSSFETGISVSSEAWSKCTAAVEVWSV